MVVRDLLEHLIELTTIEIYKGKKEIVAFYNAGADYINPNLLNAEVKEFKALYENGIRIYIKAIAGE